MKNEIKLILLGMFFVLIGAFLTIYGFNTFARGVIFLTGVSLEIFGIIIFLKNRIAK